MVPILIRFERFTVFQASGSAGGHDFVAARIDYWLHDGWSHTRPPGHRHHRGAGPSYSGTKTLVAVSTLAGEGEGSGKEVARKSRKILLNLTIPSAEKVLQLTLSPQTNEKE